MGGTNLSLRVDFLHLRGRGRSIKGPRLPETGLHLSATPLPPEVVRSFFRVFLKKGWLQPTNASTGHELDVDVARQENGTRQYPT